MGKKSVLCLLSDIGNHKGNGSYFLLQAQKMNLYMPYTNLIATITTRVHIWGQQKILPWTAWTFGYLCSWITSGDRQISLVWPKYLHSHLHSSSYEGLLKIIQRSFFLFLNENICCDPSLEPSQRDGSDDESHYMFLWKNRNNYP